MVVANKVDYARLCQDRGIGMMDLVPYTKQIRSTRLLVKKPEKEEGPKGPKE